MKYVVLDTNIIIDMMFDRKQNVASKLVESFIKLLDFDEIKIIIPAIVVHETHRHIEEQLKEVGHKIKGAIRAVQAIYGINGYKVEGLDINTYKKVSEKELKELKVKYEDNQEKYLTEVQDIVKKIFVHPNCTIIEDDEEIRSMCVRRRIYRKAPMHYEKKESYADAMIAEILLHLKSYIDIKETDEILFVTGNTADFSSSDQKKELHEDIQNDLKSIGLYERVTYVTTFGELISVQLKDEVNNANLKEEFEKELKEQEMEEQILQETELEDNERESVGLTPFSEYEDKLLDEYRESDFAEQLIGLMQKLGNCYSDLEDIVFFYSEEFENCVKGLEAEEILDFLRKWNAICDDVEGETVFEDVSGILEILDWISAKVEECNYSEIVTRLPDGIEYGDDIRFWLLEKEECIISMDELYLSCEGGSVDWLTIYLQNQEEIVAKGEIEITYGFVEYDDDGGIGDACDEDISINANDIIDYISQKVDEFEIFVKNEQEKIDMLRETYDI